MENKHRLSFEAAGSGASALRRLARSPSPRLSLSLRRSATASSIATSVESVENERQQSCVARETSRDACTLHSFITWAAVKRNECRKMTPEEKRECPLLRCRKRFLDHESMLQHLYTCDELTAGEYWCYDCGRVERLNDSNCKRCHGHPSRRRKIVSMARTFFHSLGHKSKGGSLVDLSLDMDEDPPSYDSLVAPQNVELHSNEIHEIDSHEIALPAIPESMATPDPMPGPAPRPDPLMTPTKPLPPNAVELESIPILTESLINWEPVPVSPISNGESDHGQCKISERPALQLYTHGLDQYRTRAKRRTKVLAPSSSVRSTTSTASTDSTNSTLSTTSYNISPMSAWSGAWARAADFDSTLTSPADDLMSPGGLLPVQPLTGAWEQTEDIDCCLKERERESFLPHLLSDTPMLDAFPPSGLSSTALHIDQSTLSLLQAPLSKKPLPAPFLPMAKRSTSPFNISDPGPTKTHSLVGSGWDALRMHIDESMDKLQGMSENHIANQLRSMAKDSIATEGLGALSDMLRGHMLSCPIRLLSFIHVAYSFSLVVHEQDAPRRWTELFLQALSYKTWLPTHDHQAYLHIVDALWKPDGGLGDDIGRLLRRHEVQSVTPINSAKGKEAEIAIANRAGTDPLISVAQIFLDELEYAALRDSDHLEIQTSDLCIQHLKDVGLEARLASPYNVAMDFLVRILTQQYADAPGLGASMKHLLSGVTSSSTSTVRRFELELMHAGRMCLPANEYFDSYIHQVRTQIDSLYAQDIHLNSRSTYHQHGVRLIEEIIKGSKEAFDEHTQLAIKTALDSVDELIDSMNPDMNEFDFGNLDVESSFDFSTALDSTINPTNIEEPQSALIPKGSSFSEPPTAATSSPTQSSVGQSSLGRVESHSCCEICGYRPKGDPRWFGGSMAKHKKLQHATTPPKIYRCPYPGCTSQYRNRADNLRQHQIEKGHFMDGQQEETRRRPSKRKKMD